MKDNDKIVQLNPRGLSSYELMLEAHGQDAAELMARIWEDHIKGVLKMWDDERKGYTVALDMVHEKSERVKELEAEVERLKMRVVGEPKP